MILRPFQNECLEAIQTAKQAGILSQLVSLPTGGGWTPIQGPRKFDGGSVYAVAWGEDSEIIEQIGRMIRSGSVNAE